MSTDNVAKIVATAEKLYNDIDYDMASVYFERASEICVEAAIESLSRLQDCYQNLEKEDRVNLVHLRIEALREIQRSKIQ